MSISKTQETIQHAKDQIESGKAMERLWSNNDFQKVFVEGYLRDHAAFTIRNSTSTLFTEEARKDLVASAQAVGYFDEYINKIIRDGERAVQTLSDNQQHLLVLQQEEHNN